jgi:very-short-patch-repair endonuclease
MSNSNTYKALRNARLYRVPKKKKRSRKKNSRINMYAKQLNDNLPKSEIWFDLKFKAYSKYGLFQKNKVIGKYIVDLLDSNKRIVIEVDGSMHDGEMQKFRDFVKDKYLTDRRYTVIRVKAYDEESYASCIAKLEECYA